MNVLISFIVFSFKHWYMGGTKKKLYLKLLGFLHQLKY